MQDESEQEKKSEKSKYNIVIINERAPPSTYNKCVYELRMPKHFEQYTKAKNARTNLWDRFASRFIYFFLFFFLLIHCVRESINRIIAECGTKYIVI